MKTGNLLFISAFFCGLLNPSFTNAQSTAYVKQVITGNSGKFEFTPPFTDYVTMQTYNPQTKTASVFNTINTQSVQSMVIADKMLYVAAQDSIVKYDLSSLQRMAAVKDSGLNQLAVFNGKLIVSKQYPVTSHFVEVLDTATLLAVAEITGITGDCAGISSFNDTIYVAVNGGFLGTGGNLAIIDPATWTLTAELDFGSNSIGINNLYSYGNKLFSVNKTPYGIIDTGSVTVYNPLDRSFTNLFIHHALGAGFGIKDSLLFLGVDNGVGSFNLNSMTLEDSVIIHSQGSSLSIISAAVDTLNGFIYANIGDYFTAGSCLVTSLKGDSVTSFATGISSDAVAIDYRTFPAGINEKGSVTHLSVFPNPAIDHITVIYNGDQYVKGILITDVYGNKVNSFSTTLKKSEKLSIPVDGLPAGLYCLVLTTNGGPVVSKFVKR